MQSILCVLFNIVCLSLCIKHDWIENNGVLYYISPAEQRVNYQQASAICESMDSRLTVITNQDQNDFIENNILDVEPRWIGLSNIKTPDHKANYQCQFKEFVWNYDIFCNNNYTYFENEQTPIQPSRCIGVTYKNGRWIANNFCEIHFGFICQLESKSIYMQLESLDNNTQTPEGVTTTWESLTQTSTLTIETTSTLETLTTEQASTLESTATSANVENTILFIVGAISAIVVICIVLGVVARYCLRHRRRPQSQHDKILQEIRTHHKDALRGKQSGHLIGESNDQLVNPLNKSKTCTENQSRGQGLPPQIDKHVYHQTDDVYLNENQSAGQNVYYLNDPAGQNVYYQYGNISGYENTFGGKDSREISDQGVYFQIKVESNPIVDKTGNGQRDNYYYNDDACRADNISGGGNGIEYEYVCHQNGNIRGGTNQADGATARRQKDQNTYLHLDRPASQAQSYEALQQQNLRTLYKR